MAESYLRADLEDWARDDVFAAARVQSGEIFRSKEGRRTLRFVLKEGAHHGKSYFLKYHGGIGWREILKNLAQFRLPILGAKNEFDAANKLLALGVDTLTPAAYGCRGCNPATQESFLVTDDLSDTTSLEDYCKHWASIPPDARIKKALINKVACTAKVMHENGINHRDFYICHFLLDIKSLLENGSGNRMRNHEKFRCYLIDLHRAQIRKKVPARWRNKDLAGLLYSTADIGLRKRDYLRFIKGYSNKPLRKSLQEDNWQEVVKIAIKLYQKDFGRMPSASFLAAVA